MSQELPDPYENARIKFVDAVHLWRQAGASWTQIELELELISMDFPARDPAAVKGWEP
jgi:hypothetical protein